jgi:hypothetical protein
MQDQDSAREYDDADDPDVTIVRRAVIQGL